jgi:hypothetical protein
MDAFRLLPSDVARQIVVLLLGFTAIEKSISVNCKPSFAKSIGICS